MNDPNRSLGRNVFALTAVSFLTDVSSEMIYPLLPAFLTVTLGATAGTLGAIEGAAETTASLLKLASGWWSDRVHRRKPLVLFGYGIAGLVRPLVAAAQNATQVLAVRLADRFGKGIRNAPRDALIAESVDPSVRGRAFGFNRAGDNAGAVIGPLIAFALLQWLALSMRAVFWLAYVPGALAFVTVLVFVKDQVRAPAPARVAAPDSVRTPLPRSFWWYLGVVLVFTLGNSTDAFLLLRVGQLGVPLALVPVLWAGHNLVKSSTSTYAGGLSDRLGRVPLLIAGWIWYALVYFGFAFASKPWHAWALFGAYRLYFALTEGTERALVADFVDASRRGTAFGWFHLTVGIGSLPASLLFGLVWDRWGSHSAFIMGASLAAVAAIGIAALRRPRRAA